VSVLRVPPLLGGLVGAAAALLFVAIVTVIVGTHTEVWWWPATAVAGIIGGAVLGSMLGMETEGESPDEAYNGDI
jgi:hypothetical protein